MCSIGGGHTVAYNIFEPICSFPADHLVQLTYVEFNHGGSHALPDSIVEQQLAQRALPGVCRPNNLHTRHTRPFEIQ